MARTRQTPGKSNGGSAPRVSIKKPVTNLALVQDAHALKIAKATIPAQAVVEMLRCRSDVRPATNIFCLICQDGANPLEGHLIFECDEPGCPRVICTRCMLIPSASSQELMQPDVRFRCVHCHTALEKKSGEVMPYFGFYRDEKAVLPSFLRVDGRLELSKRSQISATPILIVHFKIAGCENAASPLDAAHSYLEPYFPLGGLRLLNVVFDLGTDRKVQEYVNRCEKLVDTTMKYPDWDVLCIVITTHTNDSNGDPFVGFKRGKGGSYIASTVPDFMDTLLDPWRSVIRRADDTSLFILGCGAIVTKPDGFSGLRASVINHRFLSTVAFTAKHFHPCFASHLLISFAQAILIEWIPIRKAFPDILDQSGLGMHSDVILMTLTSGDDGPMVPLDCTHYSWAHSTIRPWGIALPMQCPQCGCATTWKRTHADFSLKSMVFECTYAACGRAGDKGDSRPHKKYTVTCKAPPGSTLLPGRKRYAGWLEIPLDFSGTTEYSDILDPNHGNSEPV